MQIYQRIRFPRRMTFISMVPSITEATPYAGGPGDIVSGAEAWWGLRAYSIATAGTNAVRLRRSSDNAEQDFATNATTGSLSASEISSFKGAGNLFVVTLYDQTGSGFPLTQANTTRQPAFTLSGLGSNPIMTFTPADLDNLTSAASMTLTQPYSFSGVGNHTTGALQSSLLFIENNGQLGYRNSADNQVFIFASAVLTATASDNTWHALQSIYQGVTSDINVDGTSNVGNAANDAGTGAIHLSGDATPAQLMNGSIVEAGVWDIAFTAGNMTDLSAQQHTYWGF